ncbi:MAG: AAA family ATPase, partial [Elusimicrobiota bacterium]
MYKRLLDLPALLSHKSFFLLGPRQTGKSTLLRASLPEAVFVDLLESETFHELSSHPERLRQRHPDRRSCLVIDEIQKLPILLNEVQLMLDRNPSLRVVMTGSSARKLRRGAANLLGGRAWMAALNPLVSAETAGVPLSQRLNRGGLPSILNSQR